MLIESVSKLKEIQKSIEEVLSMESYDDMSYTLVQWPDVQEYMEEPWFDEEAVIHINLNSAYFIPTCRL